MALTVVLATVAALIVLSALALLTTGRALGRPSSTGIARTLRHRSCGRARSSAWTSSGRDFDAADRAALARRAFPPGRALGVLPRRGQSRRRAPRASTRSATAGTRQAPQRVLPFYPLFLAAMNLVVIADDAFTFLFTWEFMSLSSWALVMAHDQIRENRARGLCLSRHGELRHARAAARLRPAGRARTAPTPSTPSASSHPSTGARRARAHSRLDRHRLQGRPGAAACLAAARPPRGAEPCLGPVERGDDQGRGLRLRAHRVRSARARPPGGGACWCWRSPASPASWACSTR